MTKKKSKVITIVSLIIVILAAIAAVGLVLKFTNGGKEDFKTFYVEHEGAKILSAQSSLDVENGKDYKFDVKYTFDVASDTARGYTVQVLPNPETNFIFTVDGQNYAWKDISDLSTFFKLEKSEKSFTISVPEDLSLYDVLTSLFPNKEIELDTLSITFGKFFMIVVTSDDAKTEYRILFDTERGSFVSSTEITLDKDSLLF